MPASESVKWVALRSLVAMSRKFHVHRLLSAIPYSWRHRVPSRVPVLVSLAGDEIAGLRGCQGVHGLTSCLLRGAFPLTPWRHFTVVPLKIVREARRPLRRRLVPRFGQAQLGARRRRAHALLNLNTETTRVDRRVFLAHVPPASKLGTSA